MYVLSSERDMSLMLRHRCLNTSSDCDRAIYAECDYDDSQSSGNDEEDEKDDAMLK